MHKSTHAHTYAWETGHQNKQDSFYEQQHGGFAHFSPILILTPVVMRDDQEGGFTRIGERRRIDVN